MTEHFITTLRTLKQIIEDMSPDSGRSLWRRDDVLETCHNIGARLQKSSDISADKVAYLFEKVDDRTFQTHETVEFLKYLNTETDAIGTADMVASVLPQLGFTSEKDAALILPIMMACVLAQVENTLSYHNTLHFQKVVLHTLRMIVAHNSIFEGTRNVLSKSRIAMLIISAAIHDLGHEGKGNISDKQYQMAKTEKQSFAYAQPYLRQAGLGDDILADIRLMLMGTDVSPFGDPISPANQIRSVYEYHFGSGDEECELELHDEFEILEQRSDLCLLCLMLHEADIMNSAAVSYDVTCRESVSVSEEVGRKQALPEDTILFFEKICGGQMLSDSARYIGSDNMKDIMQRVVDDYESGNRSYM